MTHNLPTKSPEVIDVEKFEEPEIQFLGAYRWRIRRNHDDPFVISDSEPEGDSELSVTMPRNDSDRGESDDDFLNVDVEGNWQPLARDYIVPLSAADDTSYLSKAGGLAMHSALKSPQENSRASSHTDPPHDSLWKDILQGNDKLLWMELQKLSLTSRETSQAPLKTKRKNTYFSNLSNLKCEPHTHKAPGAINHIAQCGKLLAIASSAPGGGNTESQIVDPYNTGGTLLIMSGSHYFAFDNHNLECSESNVVKYSSVNSVQFDPSRPTRLVSSGCDKSVRFWECESINEGRKPKLIQTEYFNCEPHELVFNNDGLLLAVSGDTGFVYIYHHETIIYTFQVTRSSSLISSVLWGHKHDSHLLYVSVAAHDHKGKGVHKIYDMIGQQVSYTLKNQMAGEALALSKQNNKLALITHNSKGHHFLQLYNVKQDTQPIMTVKVKPHLSKNSVLEVGDIAFSPDDIYLAVGRKDNQIHIYDSRYLVENPLMTLAHGEHLSAIHDSESKQEYGITKIEWVHTPAGNLGLVTGGADGCICLWDIPSYQSQERQILAQSDYDIGYFSLGDALRNEIPLVVGNNRGCILTTK